MAWHEHLNLVLPMQYISVNSIASQSLLIRPVRKPPILQHGPIAHPVEVTMAGCVLEGHIRLLLMNIAAHTIVR